MQTETKSRKRPAPGSSPGQLLQGSTGYPNPPDAPDISQLSDEQFLAWGAPNNDAAAKNDIYDNDLPYLQDSDRSGLNLGNNQTDAQEFNTSNQLIRRDPNQQLSRGSDSLFGNPDIAIIGDHGQDNASDESEGEMERKAAAARRDALSRRPPKQIPPFIQKLSSFLDDTRNEDLIRWSDCGKTSIVLDEETFANTLIPELFKHKNFASFVRQLNMYGFHKVLGLGDNSMRASEKKSKNPSQYKHKYFRRGRPDLLWMVTKPKPESHGPKKKKRKLGEDQESDEEADRQEEGESTQEAGNASKRNHGVVTLPRSQWASFQSEISQLKRSQQHINSMIARFQHENNQYIRQASAQHERHENSINAILTFLATFYSRSLETNDGVANLFGNAIPQGRQPRNVEDVGDFDDSSVQQQTQFPRQPRRPLALLLSKGQHGPQACHLDQSPCGRRHRCLLSTNSTPLIRHILNHTKLTVPSATPCPKAPNHPLDLLPPQHSTTQSPTPICNNRGHSSLNDSHIPQAPTTSCPSSKMPTQPHRPTVTSTSQAPCATSRMQMETPRSLPRSVITCSH